MESRNSADIMKYRLSISNMDTLSRFCGSMSKKVFPSVSLAEWYGEWGYEVWVYLAQEVDSVLEALMQAWEKAGEMDSL